MKNGKDERRLDVHPRRWFWVGVVLLATGTIGLLICLIADLEGGGEWAIALLLFVSPFVISGVYCVRRGIKGKALKHVAPQRGPQLPEGRVGKAEELIGGIMSPNLGKGLRSYGIYVTTERIIGVKGGWKQRLGIVLGAAAGGAAGGAVGPVGAGLGVGIGYNLGQQLSMDKATKSLEQLEKKKDFEVRREELEEVAMRGKQWGSTWYGRLIIKTGKQTHTIGVVEAHPEEVKSLIDMFLRFDGTKLRVEEK